MTAVTAATLKTALEAASYPYVIRFYTTIPKFPIYPYVTIIKQPPQGTEQTITDTTKTDGFEITLNIRYTRSESVEESDQATIENTILATLEAQNFGTSALYSEGKMWNRVGIPKPYGSQSSIRVVIKDKASTSGSGTLGSEVTLEIQDGSTIQVLSFNYSKGPNVEDHGDDTGLIARSVGLFDAGNYTFEYESTPDLDSEIETISSTGIGKNIKWKEKNSTKQWIALFGKTTKRGQFDNIMRAVTQFTVEGSW